MTPVIIDGFSFFEYVLMYVDLIQIKLILPLQVHWPNLSKAILGEVQITSPVTCK